MILAVRASDPAAATATATGWGGSSASARERHQRNPRRTYCLNCNTARAANTMRPDPGSPDGRAPAADWAVAVAYYYSVGSTGVGRFWTHGTLNDEQRGCSTHLLEILNLGGCLVGEKIWILVL